MKKSKFYLMEDYINITQGEGVRINGSSSDVKRGLAFIFNKIENEDPMLWAWIQWRTQTTPNHKE